MRPAQTGQGIISDGRLDAGAAARMSLPKLGFPGDDHFVNYCSLLSQSQEILCIAHIGTAPRNVCVA
jgi:hypothetical protein